MIAKFLKYESNHRCVMWEVHHGASWWTVGFRTREGDYIVTGRTGREVNPEVVLGRKIIAATKGLPSSSATRQREG